MLISKPTQNALYLCPAASNTSPPQAQHPAHHVVEAVVHKDGARKGAGVDVLADHAHRHAWEAAVGIRVGVGWGWGWAWVGLRVGTAREGVRAGVATHPTPTISPQPPGAHPARCWRAGRGSGRPGTGRPPAGGCPAGRCRPRLRRWERCKAATRSDETCMLHTASQGRSTPVKPRSTAPTKAAPVYTSSSMPSALSSYEPLTTMLDTMATSSLPPLILATWGAGSGVGGRRP
jgi:hypothetical protein